MNKRQYNFDEKAYFGLNCHYCGKQIKRIPCIMIPVNDNEEWVYFHNSCYKKFEKQESKL